MVRLGFHLRALARMRLALIASVAVALLYAASAVFAVRVLPPSLSLRSARVAGAHTQILVDGLTPGVLDTRYGTEGFDWLDQSATILTGLMVAEPISSIIAADARIPFADILFSSPQTPITSPAPQALPSAQSYSITVAAEPSIPILDVYAQGPTSAQALRLVNAAFQGLSGYVAGSGADRTLDISITQLGHGRLVYLSSGPGLLSVALRFLGALVLLCGISVLVSRARSRLRPQRHPQLAR